MAAHSAASYHYFSDLDDTENQFIGNSIDNDSTEECSGRGNFDAASIYHSYIM